MFDQNKSFNSLNVDESVPDISKKKQFIIGGIILVTIILIAGGIFYWKKGDFSFSNKEERYNLTEDIAIDTDGDGLSDYEEKLYGTDFEKADSDGDGYSDLTEIHDNRNPIGDGNLTAEMKSAIEKFNVDTDGDGLSDIEEKYYKTAIDNPDTDGDGYSDYMEIVEGLDPLRNNLQGEKTDISILDKMPKNQNVNIKNPDYDLKDYNAKEYFNIDINGSYCITEREREFEKLFNEYRASNGLQFIPLSRSLSYVAKIHSHDVIVNKTIHGQCTGHSWSDKGSWSGCCYENPDNPSSSDANCMNNKPSEITDYKWAGGENAIGGSIGSINRMQNLMTPVEALSGWINSPGHHAPMINIGVWKDIKWNAFGISVYMNNANLWLGEHTDVAEKPVYCSENNFTYCDKLRNGYLKDECFLEKSIANKNFDDCEKIIDENFKQDCYLATARAMFGVDYYVCENNYSDIQIKDPANIVDLNKKKNCVDDVNSHPEICDAMPDCERKDECYYNTAIAMKKVDICHKINGCEKKDECYHNIAVMIKEADVCRKINNWKTKDVCCLDVAIVSDDISLCDKIIYFGYRDNCLIHPNLMVEKNYNCDNLEKEETKNYCFIKKAENQKDANLCGSITDEEMKEKCYDKICTEMLPSQRPVVCSKDGWEKTADIDWCYRIEEGKGRDYCFMGFMEKYDDLNFCKYIDDFINKDICYKRCAENNRDIEACNYISDLNVKNECINYIKTRTIKN
ncbi:MAG: hypothetical protein KAI71_04060 [Candidatus Pacebacteria bacterium]|nr:hypothetical protein [Candidatus Paceibacterota bacterium]